MTHLKQTTITVIAVLLALRPGATRAGGVEEQINEINRQAVASRGASEKLLGKKARLVPIALPVSNPTIGTGLAGGLLYMHGQAADKASDQTTMTGLMGMYTSSESWAIAGFHDGYYFNDRLRVRTPLAYGSFNLQFYGVGDNSPFRENPVDYSARGAMFTPRASFALPAPNWYLGGQYRYINLQTLFASAPPPGDIPGYDARQKTSGFGLVTLFDNRDSNLWPTKGNWLDLTATYHGEYAGGDYDYLRAIGKWAQYFPLMDSIVLIYRLDGQYVEGAAPFWDLARIRLRGFSSGQYLDSVAATAQAELRWTPVNRWTFSVFGGSGWIADTVRDLRDSESNLAAGMGFRYMLVEEQKLSIGIDLAYSDTSKVEVYFQVGDWLAN